MEGSSGRGSVEVCTVQREGLVALASAADGGFVCAQVGVVGATEACDCVEEPCSAFPHNLPQGTRTNRVLLPAFLIFGFWRIYFVECKMILWPPLAIPNRQILVMMPESQ